MPKYDVRVIMTVEATIEVDCDDASEVQELVRWESWPTGQFRTMEVQDYEGWVIKEQEVEQ